MNSPFTLHYRAPNSPSLFSEHFLLCFVFTKYRHVQVDLGTPRLATSIATQAKRFTLYVKTYKLGSSDDGKTWTMYKESGTVKVYSSVSHVIKLLASVLFCLGLLDKCIYSHCECE